MDRLGTYLFGALSGAVLAAVVMHYSVVRGSDGWHFVAKLQPGLTEPYVDVRSFSAADWQRHPQLMAALIRADRSHLLADPTLDGMRETVGQWLADVAPSNPPTLPIVTQSVAAQAR
jgi:hypothetical protein